MVRRSFGVHPDAVPLVQGDRRVVAMTHRAARIHLRIAEADLPAPARHLRVAGDECLVFRFGDPVRKAPAGAHPVTAGAEHLGDHVRLATSAANWLVAEDVLLIHAQVRRGHEEPFTLADEGSVVPARALTLVQARVIRGIADFSRQQGEFRLRDRRSTAGHGRHEPLTFIVSAQKAIIRRRCFHEQEEVTIMPLALEHVHLELSFALRAELHLEELALPVGDDVQRVVSAPATPRQVFWTNDTEPRAHADELIRDRF